MKVWKTAEYDAAQAETIAGKYSLPEPVAAVLAAREWAAPEDIDLFLQPALNNLRDPYILPDMEKAVARIWQAVHDGQTIVVYGDYDVDGVTSTTLLVKVLRQLGAAVQSFLPHRVDDGYGMSIEPVTRCLEEFKPGLIVSVDCGTGSVEAVEYARSHDVDVVVTDHHELAGKAAPASALVNPKLGDAEPEKNLAGVGVVFKLCHALVKSGRDQGVESAEKIDLKDYLDLTALGTVCDIVPLLGENRTLVWAGLNRLAQTKHIGLKALLDVAEAQAPYTAYTFGFQLGPRLNAAGRLGTAHHALDLLMAEDIEDARRLASDLDRTNRERRAIEAKTVEEAEAMIDQIFDPQKDCALVVSGATWHPGVVGIVASRLVRKYNRPAVVIAVDEEGMGKGSCRSIADFNILENLEECQMLLDRWGGHAMAAGLEIKAERIGEFREAFNRVAEKSLRHADLRPSQTIDAWIGHDEFNERLYDAQQRLEPFGMDNDRPVWGIKNVQVSGQPRIVGRGHLKLQLALAARTVSGIKFGWGERPFPEGNVDVAFYMKLNTFRGQTNLEMDIRDIRPSQKD